MEQIEQRKEKAAELSSGRHANTDYAPKLTPYERKKQCSLCNVLVRLIIIQVGMQTILIIMPCCDEQKISHDPAQMGSHCHSRTLKVNRAVLNFSLELVDWLG